MARLGNLGKIITGNTPKTSETENYCSNDICFVKPSDILDGEITRITDSEFYISEHARQKSRILPPQSVMVTCIGIIGKVAINQVECAFNQQINAVIPDIKKCLPVYLAYAIQYKQAELQNIANSSVVPILNKSQFSNVEVTVPTLTQQHEVIDELEKISELIALRKQQLAKLDELVKSRFIELFGVPGAKSDQWPRMSLGDCCILNPKKNLDTRLVPELNVSFVPMSAVSEDGDMEVSETRKYEDVKTGFTYFADNDILFAKITPCMENGKGAIARNLINGIGFGSTEFHVLRPIQNKSNPYWLYVMTAFESFRTSAKANMTGSAGQKRVPASYLESYQVSLPPMELQEQFASFVKQTNQSKPVIRQSLDQLETLKKNLMQEYFG